MPASKPEPARFACPNCGAMVPSGALACPDCGSDDETGWSPDTIYDNVDLPEAGYARSLPADSPPRRRTKSAFWRVVAVIVLLVLAFLILTGRW